MTCALLVALLACLGWKGVRLEHCGECGRSYAPCVGGCESCELSLYGGEDSR